MLKEDIILAETNENNTDRDRNDDNDSPGSPRQPLTKSQKIYGDVEAAKKTLLERRDEEREWEWDQNSNDDHNVGVVGEKQRKGKDHAQSDDEGARQPDILHFSSQPPLSGLHQNWHQVVAKEVPNASRRHTSSTAPSPPTAKAGSVVPRNTIHPGSFEFEDNTDPGDDLNECMKMQIPVLEGDDDPLLAPLSINIIKNPPSKTTNWSASIPPTATRALNKSQHLGPLPPVPHENMTHAEQEVKQEGKQEGNEEVVKPYRHYMRKMKVVGHQLKRPPPEIQGSQTNSNLD
ncbi:uncharacterized protein F5891DRAFT_978216 [Suillus fuscotomentosus]|uniref:Uncharacterized protein n=1 Tax=Suillus fuscotomentosus TaxID=1912939 RepID=A0AAD4HNP4_9AGAM|nr:uncharacterized protein F5891DRAFT_978216 [Suillus fuscotomentosus]KAG1903192.1 hypothetical protein F5891DRAFT_978216 [Suillus fuscotomentosus]